MTDREGQEGPGKEELCLLGQLELADWGLERWWPPCPHRQQGLPETGINTESRSPETERPGLRDVAEPQDSPAFGFFCLDSQSKPVLAEGSSSPVSVIDKRNHVGCVPEHSPLPSSLSLSLCLSLALALSLGQSRTVMNSWAEVFSLPACLACQDNTL